MVRTEAEVEARLAAIEAETEGLSREIKALTDTVQAGGPGWQTALERLAACYRRRRLLGYRRETLAWVLATLPAQRAS